MTRQEAFTLLGVYILGMVWIILNNIYDISLVLCPTKILFGIPCPGCGMTRAVKLCLEGELLAHYLCRSWNLGTYRFVYSNEPCKDVQLQQIDDVFLNIRFEEEQNSSSSKTKSKTTMNDKINMLLMTYSKYFPDESMMMIRDRFEAMDESKTSMLYTLGLKDPTMALILSIVAGGLGIDRFYIGDTGLGIAKLLTCGGCGIWTIIDYFLIMKVTKEKNLEKFITVM